MATIRITDLRLRAIIGTDDTERDGKQDIVINAAMEFDAEKAARLDDLNETVNYKAITEKIIPCVENSQFYLLEKLTSRVLDIIMEDKKVLGATVRIDKPRAVPFTKSVSVEMNRQREGQ